MDSSSHPVRVVIRPGMVVAFPAGMGLKEIETTARQIQLSDLTTRYEGADKAEQEKIRDAVLQHSIALRKAAKRKEISEDEFQRTQRQISAFSNHIASAVRPARKRK